MSLTLQQIWEQYSHIEFKRHVYVKRLNTDGTYEADFNEITQGLKDGGVQSISRALPNSSWQFGYVTVGNVQIQILSAYQEFANEQDPNSIFFGFVRNYSIVKIVDAYVDKYTDPLNPVEAQQEVFEGLLDSTTAQTEQGYEQITAVDYLYTLNNVNVSDLNLISTTLSDLVYEIMNRPEFTQYFSVSNSPTYISPGFDIQGIDVTQYASDTVMDMLQDLAQGHSIFYINPEDGFFYFNKPTPTPTVQFSFLEQGNRKLLISAYREGIDRQITSWYWNNSGNFLLDNWTSTGWTGDESNGWVNVPPNVAALSESTPALVGVSFIITATVSGRTAGSFDLSFGGQDFPGLTSSLSATITALNTNNLIVTPTSTFDGTIIITVQLNITAIKTPSPVHAIPSEYEVEGVSDPVEQQDLLNYVLSETENAKPYFQLELPYFPVINLLDRVVVQSFGSAPPFAARWGMFQFTATATNNPNAAPRWFKPAGIRISQDLNWMVRSITHDNNLKTTLELELIPV